MHENELTLPFFTDYARLSQSQSTLISQCIQNKTLHAYMLIGPQGIGKRTFTRILVCALFCTSPKKPCGTCPACQQVLSETLPDLHILRSNEGKRIGVEQVREVLSFISQHAFYQNMHVVIIEALEMMTPQAQNALLKSLEEPSSNVVFFLMAKHFGAALGTIASRCMRVNMLPWPDDIITSTLQRYGYTTQRIEGILSIAGGNIGVALDLLSDTETRKDIDSFVQSVFAIRTDSDIVRLSTKLKDQRDRAIDYLNALEQALYQLYLATTERQSINTLQSFPQAWQQAVVKMPLSHLNDLFASITEAKRRRLSQVNWQSTLDQLLIQFREELLLWQS